MAIDVVTIEICIACVAAMDVLTILSSKFGFSLLATFCSLAFAAFVAADGHIVTQTGTYSAYPFYIVGMMMLFVVSFIVTYAVFVANADGPGEFA